MIARWRGLTVLVPALLTLLFLLTAAAAAARHEMWKDEIIAWLLARDARTPWDLFSMIKYEGHPGLWHLLLWPVAHLTWNPAAMQGLHVLIASAAVFVLLRYAPFSWPVRMATAAGYFLAYEWAVIARNYAISVLLFFIFCALYGRRWQRFPLLAIVLFLLCHTNVHSLLLVAVLFAVLLVEFAVAWIRKWPVLDGCRRRIVFGFVLIAAGLATAVVQIKPPPDSGFAPEWRFTWELAHVQQVAGVVTRAYVPLPPDRLTFWYGNRLIEAGGQGAPRPWYAVPADRTITVAVCILMAGCLFFLTRPWMAVPYIAGSLALCGLFYVKYIGSARHHGFLFLLFLTTLWLSTHYPRWRAPWRWLDAGLSFWDRHRMTLLLPLLLVHVWGASIALRQDWGGTFSNARAAAAWIRGAFPDRSRLVFVGDDSANAVPVVGYLPLDRIFYPDRNEFGAHLILDRRWSWGPSGQLVRRVPPLIASQQKDAFLILSFPLPKTDAERLNARFLKSIDASSISGESYYLYLCPFQPQAGARDVMERNAEQGKAGHKGGSRAPAREQAARGRGESRQDARVAVRRWTLTEVLDHEQPSS
jgi:hypothetical protein